MEMHKEMGAAASLSAYQSELVVNHLTGAATEAVAANLGGRLAVIQMPLVESQHFAAIARLFGWASAFGGLGDSALFSARRRLASDRMATFFADQIPHSDAAIAALTGYRKVMLVKELRRLLVTCLQHELQRRAAPQLSGSQSSQRQAADGRSQMYQFLCQQGPMLFGQFLSTLTWMAERDVVILRSEDLAQPDDALAERLTRLLRIDGTWSAAIDAATLRRVAHLDLAPDADQAMRLEDYWDAETERLFTAFGGCLWNRALGYDRLNDFGTQDLAGKALAGDSTAG